MIKMVGKSRYAGQGSNARLPMSSCPNYTSGLVHLVLCAASGWALKICGITEYPIAFATFAFLVVHSLLGVFKYTHPETPRVIEILFSHSLLIATTAPLPIINTQFYLDHRQPVEVAYSHAGSAIITQLSDLMLPGKNTRIIDFVMAANISSLAYMAIISESYWAMGLAILMVINHFVLERLGRTFDVPQSLLCTIGLCFFSIFAANCLQEEHMDDSFEWLHQPVT